MAVLKKRRERKWAGAIDLTGVSEKEAKRRMTLAHVRFMKDLARFYKEDRKGFNEWIEGIKMRTEEMAHEEIKPYREWKTKKFSKMTTPELEVGLVKAEGQLKRLDKDEYLYDRHFAIFAEEDMNIIKDILAKRKRQ